MDVKLSLWHDKKEINLTEDNSDEDNDANEDVIIFHIFFQRVLVAQ